MISRSCLPPFGPPWCALGAGRSLKANKMQPRSPTQVAWPARILRPAFPIRTRERTDEHIPRLPMVPCGRWNPGDHRKQWAWQEILASVPTSVLFSCISAPDWRRSERGRNLDVADIKVKSVRGRLMTSCRSWPIRERTWMISYKGVTSLMLKSL